MNCCVRLAHHSRKTQFGGNVTTDDSRGGKAGSMPFAWRVR
jgi:hypothetical protein